MLAAWGLRSGNVVHAKQGCWTLGCEFDGMSFSVVEEEKMQCSIALPMH